MSSPPWPAQAGHRSNLEDSRVLGPDRICHLNTCSPLTPATLHTCNSPCTSTALPTCSPPHLQLSPHICSSPHLQPSTPAALPTCSPPPKSTALYTCSPPHLLPLPYTVQCSLLSQNPGQCPSNSKCTVSKKYSMPPESFTPRWLWNTHWHGPAGSSGHRK